MATTIHVSTKHHETKQRLDGARRFTPVCVRVCRHSLSEPKTPVSTPGACISPSCYSGLSPFPVNGFTTTSPVTTNGGCLRTLPGSAFSCAESIVPITVTSKSLQEPTYDCNGSDVTVSTSGCDTHTDTINLRKGTTTGQACDYCTGN